MLVFELLFKTPLRLVRKKTKPIAAIRTITAQKMQIAQASSSRVFDLGPNSELRFSLSIKVSPQQQAAASPHPFLSVRLEPRDGVPVRADWFGFSTATASGGARERLTFRLGCVPTTGTASPPGSSTALFSTSGCLVTVEGPASVVLKCVAVSFFERDTTSVHSIRYNNNNNNHNNINSENDDNDASSASQQHQQQSAWPLWRRQVTQLHSVFHEQRMSAYQASTGDGEKNNNKNGGGGDNNDDDAELMQSIGPRVLVCGSKAGSGRTTICKLLLNLAARDGFQPLFIAADPSGTSIVGQPGCYAACVADAGIDPTEDGAHFPTVQVPLPLEDCPRNKLAEPSRHTIATLIEMADRRTFSVKSCAAAGLIVDTDPVDEVLLDDELERIVAIIEECTIEAVIVVGSENLRQSLRFRLQRNEQQSDANNNNKERTMSGAESNNNPFFNAFGGGGGGGGAGGRGGEYSEIAAATRREELSRTILSASPETLLRVQRLDGSVVALHSCAVVDGAEDRLSGGCGGIVARRSRWYRYFCGTPSTPLSSFSSTLQLFPHQLHQIGGGAGAASSPSSSSSGSIRWIVLRSQSSGYGGLLPLQGAGEEQKSEYRATVQLVSDLHGRYVAHLQQQAQLQRGSGSHHFANLPLMAAVLRVSGSASIDSLIDSGTSLCRAPVLGFVAVTHVAADGSTADILAPSKILPTNCVFALMHQTAQA